MPYIDDEAKNRIAPSLEVMVVPKTSGELNYKLTVEVIDYLMIHGLSYETCNDIIGALDNCKDEFRRRVQHPYEDKAIKRNGDIYPKEITGA